MLALLVDVNESSLVRKQTLLGTDHFGITVKMANKLLGEG
jgi:hypothetical protein